MKCKIGSVVKKHRQIKGYSQENMAMDLGLSQSQYSRRESGKIQFTIAEIMKIAVLLDIDLDVLLGKEQSSHAKNTTPINYKEKDMGKLITQLIEVLVASEENRESRLHLINNITSRLRRL